MRLYPVFAFAVLPLVVASGCTKQGNAGDDDPTDGGTDATPVAPECSPFGARAQALEAFAAPQGLQARITSFIDGAQDTLDVAMYLFTVDAIANRLVAAKQRGVAVRVLFDPDHAGNDDTRTDLAAAGVTVRDAPSLYAFSHAKYMIADGEAALIMSANFNVDAMNNERNYGVIDRDPDDLADLQAIYDQDWAAGGGEPAQLADLACTRLVASPTNAKPRLVELIDGARSTLEVEALYISEVGVRDAILAAKQRGVAVRVILERGSDNLETKQLLLANGIAVHDASGFFNHAKLIIADGVAFVGSQNFSTSAMTRNREIGVFVPPAQAGPVQQQFESDWTNTAP